MTAARKLCAVSVDLDSIECYYRIHGLGEPPPGLGDIIMRRALPRFAALFARRGIPATLFVVGRDLELEGGGDAAEAAKAARAQLGVLVKAGHELGNHSYSHFYDLARRDRGVIRRELGRAHTLLREVMGGAGPVGFRAPGYDVSVALLDEVAAAGYLYDSSVFPAPLYYSAKAAVMAAMGVMGRWSGAVLGDPRALLAPTDPYRPHPRSPWRRGQSPLLELPIGVTPGLRVPAIGTYLVATPVAVRTRILEAMRARPVFNLECHGIDLCDAEHDGIPGELVAKQHDLRVPLTEKLRAMEATLDRLAPEYEFVTLKGVAQAFQRGALKGQSGSGQKGAA